MNTKHLIIICVSIIAGLVLHAFIITSSFGTSDASRYEFISHGDTLIIGDRQTGDYWEKYNPQFEGSTEWSHTVFPGK